jgi:quercetin dioxygenase-like cupin family protein
MKQENKTGKRIFENPVIGDKVRFIKTSEETNGEYTLVEVELAAKGGNTLHTHADFTETFRPVDGPLTVRLGKELKVLQPGDAATVPLHLPHYFQNPTDRPVKFMVELRPGHTGFENALKIAYGLAKDGLTNKKSIPNNFLHLAVLVNESGTIPSGFYSLVMPLIRWQARKAIAKGIDKELIAKYC